MEDKVRDAVFGNVGTLVSFRVGAEDAEFLEKEFSPEFMATDIVNLEKFTVYLKLMVDGVATRPFWARTLSPFPVPEGSDPEAVLTASREKYSVSREKVESAIAQWSTPVERAKEEKEPREDKRPPMRDKRPFDRKPSRPQGASPRKTGEKPMGLQEALKRGPVDFKGRPAQTKRPEVDTGGLKNLLEEVQKEK
jgi:hypothetical protein